MPVTLIRHAHSCTNLSRQFKEECASYSRPARRSDPELTAMGASQARQRGGGDSGVVYSSPLVRALQTALLLFPRSTVVVIPWACENHGSLPKHGGSLSSLRRRLGRLVSPEDLARCDFRRVAGPDGALLQQAYLSSFARMLLEVGDGPVVTHSGVILKGIKALDKLGFPGASRVRRHFRGRRRLPWTNLFAVDVSGSGVALRSPGDTVRADCSALAEAAAACRR